MLTKEDKIRLEENIKKLYKEGYSYGEITEIAKCSRTTVSKTVSKFEPKKERKEKRNAEVLTLYRKGLRLKTIMARTGCSRTTVWRIINENVKAEDIKIRSANKPIPPKHYPVKFPEKVKKEIYKEYLNKTPYKEMEKKYGASKTTIWRVVKEQKEYGA